MLETWNLKWNGTWNNIDVSDLNFYIDTSIWPPRAISCLTIDGSFPVRVLRATGSGQLRARRLGFSFFFIVSFHFSVSHSTSLLVLDSRIHRIAKVFFWKVCLGVYSWTCILNYWWFCESTQSHPCIASPIPSPFLISKKNKNFEIFILEFRT